MSTMSTMSDETEFTKIRYVVQNYITFDEEQYQVVYFCLPDCNGYIRAHINRFTGMPSFSHSAVFGSMKRDRIPLLFEMSEEELFQYDIVRESYESSVMQSIDTMLGIQKFYYHNSNLIQFHYNQMKVSVGTVYLDGSETKSSTVQEWFLARHERLAIRSKKWYIRAGRFLKDIFT